MSLQAVAWQLNDWMEFFFFLFYWVFSDSFEESDREHMGQSIREI